MGTHLIQLHRRSILTKRLMHWETIVVILSLLGATVQITLRLKLWTTIINIPINGKRVPTIHFQIQTCKLIQLKAKNLQKVQYPLLFDCFLEKSCFHHWRRRCIWLRWVFKITMKSSKSVDDRVKML